MSASQVSESVCSVGPSVVSGKSCQINQCGSVRWAGGVGSTPARGLCPNSHSHRLAVPAWALSPAQAVGTVLPPLLPPYRDGSLRLGSLAALTRHAAGGPPLVSQVAVPWEASWS